MHTWPEKKKLLRMIGFEKKSTTPNWGHLGITRLVTTTLSKGPLSLFSGGEGHYIWGEGHYFFSAILGRAIIF